MSTHIHTHTHSHSHSHTHTHTHTHIHTEDVITYCFPCKKWLHEQAPMLRYTYIAVWFISTLLSIYPKHKSPTINTHVTHMNFNFLLHRNVVTLPECQYHVCVQGRHYYQKTNVLMTNEMHNSYNQFLFHSFLSALHVSNESRSPSSGALHNILYYTAYYAVVLMMND